MPFTHRRGRRNAPGRIACPASCSRGKRVALLVLVHVPIGDTATRRTGGRCCSRASGYRSRQARPIRGEDRLGPFPAADLARAARTRPSLPIVAPADARRSSCSGQRNSKRSAGPRGWHPCASRRSRTRFSGVTRNSDRRRPASPIRCSRHRTRAAPARRSSDLGLPNTSMRSLDSHPLGRPRAVSCCRWRD